MVGELASLYDFSHHIPRKVSLVMKQTLCRMGLHPVGHTKLACLIKEASYKIGYGYYTTYTKRNNALITLIRRVIHICIKNNSFRTSLK